jgi:hypothetical protein
MVSIWLGIAGGIFMVGLGVVVLIISWRRGYLSSPVGRRAAVIGSLVFFLIGIPLIAVGGISGTLNARHEVDVCTVSSVTYDPSRSGAPDWDVATNCGGALYIDPDATGQLLPAATTLADSMSPGHVYRLTIQGTLGNPFDISAYLLAAAPR